MNYLELSLLINSYVFQKLFVDDEILIKSFLKLSSIQTFLENLLEANSVSVENKTLVGLFVILFSSEAIDVPQFLNYLTNTMDSAVWNEFTSLFTQDKTVFKRKLELIATRMCEIEPLELFVRKTLDKFTQASSIISPDMVEKDYQIKVNGYQITNKHLHSLNFLVQRSFDTPPVPESKLIHKLYNFIST